ncbi:MAG: GxxExxY protein [Prevotella sp.]|jgi:GxxExxY protein
MTELICKEEAYAIIGAAMEVHKHLGSGFLEKAYQDAMEIELAERGIPFEREKQLQIMYKGKILQHDYYADFVCYGKIIVEIKAVSKLMPEHRSQVLNYLNCCNCNLGLLINFGQKSLVYERVVCFNQ